ncbi:FK506-binding protein 2 [Strongylocentrotus purpuratus]|uniref:peptidylprolyl isomerase n=1 Tax=Strongylocentrotus purpuratus TaxID=7668 RepID=A0A7M7RE77_STRPU|nr:FK506-binding protein 2 [Strongylocentrotus purpuratus]
MILIKYESVIVGIAIVCTCLSIAHAAKKKKPKELEIISEYKPEECTVVAQTGDVVKVHYTGTFENGAIFDSSRQDNREPIDFKLGGKMVIQGWELGIEGMCIGEKRKLIIPPHLGYGKKGSGPIPPDSTLVFETELVDLQKPETSLANRIMKLVRFIVPPSIVILLLYYMWEKSAKNPLGKLKGDRRGKKKR